MNIENEKCYIISWASKPYGHAIGKRQGLETNQQTFHDQTFKDKEGL